eukprot:Platyproteum_vivax@DN4979_c0_g1_i1.p1
MTSSELTQIIDFDMQFVGNVDEFMHNCGLAQKGFDFSLVTVLGCQSSGKSTLLNRMFSTHFQELNAAAGRGQTTKGVWLGVDPKTATIVVDVEGTDSAARGEDRLTFEHRAALFSLALADVVIVNFWYHDIGRYTASNYGLLKTVMAVNLELFYQEDSHKKTHLLFVIRDWTPEITPLESLEKVIYADIQHIWEEVKKPPRFSGAPADQFFDFHTYGLAPKIHQPAEFLKGVKKLRDKWLTDWRPKEYSRHVPADGFGQYCKSIWEAIVTHSELDIPTQKEMLASFRCEEIKATALSNAVPALAELLSKAQSNTIEHFSSAATTIITQGLEDYEAPASRYLETVYLKKRAQLMDALYLELQKIFLAHINHVRAEIVKNIEEKLKEAFGRASKASDWANFNSIAKDLIESGNNELEDKGGECAVSVPVIPGGPSEVHCFDISVPSTVLINSLEAMVERHRSAQVGAFTKLIQRSMIEVLTRLDSHLSMDNLDIDSMWKVTNELTVNARDRAVDQLKDAAQGLGIEESEFRYLCSTEALNAVKLRVQKVVTNFDIRVAHIFEDYFSNDEDGVPHRWPTMSEAQIKTKYLDAKTKALRLIPLFKQLRLEVEGLASGDVLERLISEGWQAGDEQMTILTDKQQQQAEQKANKAMQNSYEKALLMMQTGGKGIGIPMWFWGILLVLGWNEFMTVLQSPIFFSLIIIAAAIGYWCYTTKNYQVPFVLAKQAAQMGTTFLIPMLEKINEAAAVPANSASSPRRLPKEVLMPSRNEAD